MADVIPLNELRPAPELSIAIVSWNSERWIERCLKAIPAACDGLPHEIVLYDNASHDTTLRRVGGEARVMASSSNDGFAPAVNRLIQATDAPFVFLLNPDCELAPRSLRILIDFMRSRPEAAAVAPLLADERGESQREFQLRRFPTFLTFAFEALAIDKLLPSNPVTSRYRYRDLDLTQPQRVDQPAAAALLLRRDALKAIGPLDEQFTPAWFEDVDYCRRIAAAGLQIWVVPQAEARHVGGASLEFVTFAQFADFWYANMFRYARKWFSRTQVQALRWLIVLGMLLRLPAALVGLAHRESGRWTVFRGYAGVLWKALSGWRVSSPSS